MHGRADTPRATASHGIWNRCRPWWKRQKRRNPRSSRASTAAFCCGQGKRRWSSLDYYASLRAALARAKVPVTFLLNESDSLTQIEHGIDLGFDAVMPENEELPKEEYLRLVKQVVEKAHAKGVSVEAQVGHLADASGGTEAEPTEPEAARAFVNATQIDALGRSGGECPYSHFGKEEP